LAWGTSIVRWTAVDQRLPEATRAEMEKRAETMKPLATAAR
jgi:hypothetical protein